MSDKAKKWLKFTLRWGIAVVGIWLVIRQMSLHDRVWVVQDDKLVSLRLWQAMPPDVKPGQAFRVYEAGNPAGREIKWHETANKPEKKKVLIKTAGGTQEVPLVGVNLIGDLNKSPKLDSQRGLYVVIDGKGQWISPDRLAPRAYEVRAPHPRVEAGLKTMLREARGAYLVFAVLIFPVTFIVTSFRWHELLKALGIHLTLARTFVINMVGAFYNTFLLGSTGGDVLKAYYASKQTVHRTRAVMSVFVDRAVGLVSLIILGGSMATYQWLTSTPDDPAAHACARVAILSAAIIFTATAGFFFLHHPGLRKAIGLDWFLSKLPKQKQVKNAVQTMEMYGQRKLLVLGTIIATFPVHITVVLSALLAGKAFGLEVSPLYYFVAVPVIVLSGAIPGPPQGAGVMEYFAIILLGRQGATVSEAFALTMSIRMVQILWNLTGGIFVFRGGYHQPTEREQEEMETDSDPAPAKVAAA